jgi:hypothetical protein
MCANEAARQAFEEELARGPYYDPAEAACAASNPTVQACLVADCLSIREAHAVLEDLIGNPFKTVIIAPSLRAWNEGSIPKIAQAIYDCRLFEATPLLAASLEEAGCQDAELVNHLRGTRHYRGCWAVDLLVGRE